MSFILDGLKKLEEKQHRDSVPDLLTVHSPVPQRSKKDIWPYLLIAVLLINALLLLLWLRPWQSEVQVTDEKIALKAGAGNSAASHAINTPAAETGAAVQADEQTIETDTIAPAAVETPLEVPLNEPPAPEQQNAIKATSIQDETALSDRPLKLSELPPSIRQELPEINISAHIYSNNTSSRIVNINGSVIREGGKISPGLYVDEITVTGVILKYNEYRFSMRGL